MLPWRPRSPANSSPEVPAYRPTGFLVQHTASLSAPAGNGAWQLASLNFKPSVGMGAMVMSHAVTLPGADALPLFPQWLPVTGQNSFPPPESRYFLTMLNGSQWSL
ncbi:hypothetical protein SKAU_G00132640 [Synaphobranchus kaupii]|uniref:Uncharacterized protein n=1 Tax=Synaphobranchus kaupii TaxID=118154 RepID=A0A9Q1FRQ2_SYNKA|nr:hypothetical protein SKAU_G00132640 [Synaphobranchus kaupii]